MPSARAFVALIALGVTAAPLAGQNAESLAGRQPSELGAASAQRGSRNRGTELPISLAPVAQNLAVGVRAVAVQPAPLPVPRRSDTSHNRALMIVGGVTLLVGAVIGGDPGTIIMIGGGVIGIYGLYKYLQ
ncbi:MAG TPA: hypothetical protein VHE78_17670 [Gemmatimonadaceae bacterium]|nr:hypothetical protein [Gemmatimonadaceae bacterium]